jgi:sigma-B regulation protein RsbU (phosphoserine phosphatase)
MRETPLILIVEDNPASLEIIQARLVANNYDVITAADGEKGLEQARGKLPDLILLDIMMPKMDGLEVCRRLKSDTTLPFMPIIMVTAKADPKDVVAGLEAGGDEYLAKPVDHRSLLARVHSMLRIKELHDMVLDQSNEMKSQLKTATKVQSLFWPNIPKLPNNLNIWAFSEPASYVGGDLYDIIGLSDDSLLAYVADVAGKGVAAALIMAALSTMIRSEAPFHHNLDELLQIVNKRMYSLCSDEGYFATIILSRYWPESGRLQLLRAGHPNPLWISGGGIVALPQLKGVSLGITEVSSYETQEIILSPGDSCLLYSDGVLEAENDALELYGDNNLQECVRKGDGPPYARGVLDAVNNWRGDAEINDDLTILEIWHRAR